MAYYIAWSDVLHQEVKFKKPIYQRNIQFIGKKESVIEFTFVVLFYYYISFKYASLCNLIKLEDILRKYAESEHKRF